MTGPHRSGGAGHGDAEELFTACHARLTRWVRRLVGDDEVAHDIAAEAFARLLVRWSRLDNPRSYLFMIAANLVNDYWREASRQQNAISKLVAGRAGTWCCHPAEVADLGALIDALPGQLRTAFLLHHCAGYRVWEIAAMLGRPEGTVKSDLHHARSRLRAGLTPAAA